MNLLFWKELLKSLKNSLNLNIPDPQSENCRKHPITRKQKFLFLSLVPAYFIFVGLIFQTPIQILSGIKTIIAEPDFLITDYFLIGGVGAAFANAGLLTLMSILMIYILDMNMDGHTITSCCLMFGFSLFGKNLFNIWAILSGIFLYAKYHKTSVRRYLYVGLYGTSLSPIITQVMQIPGLPVVFRFISCIAVGILIGFVLPPLATHVHFAHKGYSLYNVGFASGIIATVIVSLFKSFGIETASRLIWSTGENGRFAVILGLLFGGMILSGILFGRKEGLKNYAALLKHSGLGVDFLKEYGGPATVINMGVNGIFATAFAIAVGGDLNGPTIGGIFTIVGFSATGKHIRNIVPIMCGVFIASLTKEWNIYDPSPMLALLFSTTLAPIAGEFGVLAGLIAGYLHSSVALNVGIVYGGMNLYNNGFAGGIVAIFMVPVIQSVLDRRAKARGGLSL
ncbi:MAG: DUF1576 domain-containing protein [Lachnospiraceae bacterium]|nr:DUF1576 domain-containing protein [Lachnospiraceae bacterium]